MFSRLDHAEPEFIRSLSIRLIMTPDGSKMSPSISACYWNQGNLGNLTCGAAGRIVCMLSTPRIGTVAAATALYTAHECSP